MKKLTALFFSVCIFFTAFADTFTVTSNADRGTGTLREAIARANANGTGVTDYIYFNIADVSITGRTILLLTSFPDLTSDIIIDGSTQPGMKIGVSDAKIRISNPDGATVNYVFRIIDQKNIGIYGLHLHHIKGTYDLFGVMNVIQLRNAQNISIGDKGRGNYFTDLEVAVGAAQVQVTGYGMITGLSFKSNIVNLTEDGTAIYPGKFSNAISLTNVQNLDVGGELPGEGNYMSGIMEIMLLINTDTAANINTGYIRILNNKFGCNYTQTKGLKCGATVLRNSRMNYIDTTNILIKGNTYDAVTRVGSNTMQTFLNITGKSGFIDIKANRIGMVVDLTSWFSSNINSAIQITNCENGIIGGDNPSDANIIAGAKTLAVSIHNNKIIKITKNSIFCNSMGIAAYSGFVEVPKTKIFTVEDYFIKGTTAPNSLVEVFLTKECILCDNGKIHLGNTTADANGDWSFTSSTLLDGAVSATGTSPLGATGEFAKPEFTFDHLNTMYPTCNQNTGFIHGAKFISGTRYYWLYKSNGKVDTIFSENVENAGAGAYEFVAEQGKYCFVSNTVMLYDYSPKIRPEYKMINNPSCGLNNGSIYNLTISGKYNKIFWKDMANNIVSDKLVLNNINAGQYKLIVLDTIHGCGDSTDFYTLVNQSGPSLKISSIQISPATCTTNSGSIKGITALNATGTPFIQWLDSLNKPVGNDFDLLNVLPGKYRLKFKDETGCDTIITPFYLVADNGNILIDTSGKLVTPGKCSGVSGSIQQLQVTGGDGFQWMNMANNSIVGASLNVFDLAPGDYQLKVTNNLGCTNKSPVINVAPTVFNLISVTNFTSKNALCGEGNGAIKIHSFNKDPGNYIFRWVDSTTSQTIGVGTSLDGLNKGGYQLLAKDSNGCEKEIFSVHVSGFPVPGFDYSQVITKNDNCNLNEGGISHLKVNGLTGPATFTWYDQYNKVAGNGIDLQNAGAGSYVLKVVDEDVCNIRSHLFTISNADNALTAPKYQSLTIPRYADAAIVATNSGPGNYNLLRDAAGSIILQQNNNGNFILPKIATDTSFYIQLISGSCSSPVVKVNIKVVDKSYFAIPNAFTPNGDGINDRLSVRVIGSVELDYFRIYNQWGELVYETHRLNDGWNGIRAGILQNAGVFVWVAKGKDINKNVITDKGSFILIR